MSKVLGSIFGFGNKMKRRLRDAASNPKDYLEMTADENQNEWRKNPDERSMGFFNPVSLGKVDPFLLRKQMKEAIDEIPSLSRRDFMKKSGGIAVGTAAASIPGAKLLRKFAPEEKQIAKEVAAEVAPKYKYNSLRDYLDDVESKVYSKYDDAEPFSAMSSKDQIRERLLQDEEAYNTSKFFYKDNLKGNSPGEWIDPFTGQPQSEEFLKNIRNTTNDFSPQAKKEMKEFKTRLKNNLFDNVQYPKDHPKYQEYQQYLDKQVGEKWPNFLDDYVNGDGKKYF